MLTISLNDLQFHAFHGIHEEEKILGNAYVVDCIVQVNAPQTIITRIDDTINYQTIFEIVQKEMSVPTPLLETLCMRIGQQIHTVFPDIASCEVSIKKLRPPVRGFDGSSSVRWRQEY